MWDWICQAAGGIAQSVAGYFGLANKWQDDLDTPEMKANRQAQIDAETAAKLDANLAKAQKTGDLTEVRKDDA